MPTIMKAERKTNAVSDALDSICSAPKFSIAESAEVMRALMVLYERAYLDCLEELTEKRSRELEAVR